MTDLTFHNMEFLKQPRREPQRPLSRKREAERKRSDREREEISAFFIQGSVPGTSATRDRNVLAATWPSSADGATPETSSRISGRQRLSSQPDFLTENGIHLAMAQEQRRADEREGSKTTTYLSWPTSREAAGTRVRLGSKSPEKQDGFHTHSSTPPDVREALAETGIYHNTGVCHMAPGNKRDETSSRDEPSKARQSEIYSRAQASRRSLDEPVRIVRYKDRGTMVTNEDAPYPRPDKHMREICVNTLAATGLDSTLEASKPPKTLPIVSPIALASEAPIPLFSRTEDARSEPDIGPERPTSPKLSVVERLEAAANSHRQHLMEHEARRVTRDSDRYAVHSDRSSEFMPHSHQGNYRWPTLTDKLGTTQHVGMPVIVSSCFTSKEPTELVVRSASVHDMADETADIEQSYEPPRRWPAQVPPLLLANQNLTRSTQDRQSMQEYITQLEQEVLDRPQEDPVFESAPLGNPDNTEVDDNVESAHHQFQTQIDVQTLSRVSAATMQQSPSGAPHLRWVRAWNYDNPEEEERRFMSSFWRPNRHLI